MSKKARRGLRRDESGVGAIWNDDPKGRVSALADRLLNVPGPASIAEVQLQENANDVVGRVSVSEYEMKAVVVGAQQANDLDVATGKEDLVCYLQTLGDALDAIPDEDERDRAYDALYWVLDATHRIARSIDSLNELQRNQAKNLAAMATAMTKKLAKRDEIVVSIIDDRKRRGKPASWRALRLLINDELRRKGFKEISERTFDRAKGKRKKI